MLVTAAAALAAAGCAHADAVGPQMQLVTASVQQPGSADATDAYLVIRNDGPADRLIAARTSAGGTVTLRGPGPQGPAQMRTVPAIPVPAGQLIHLSPNGYHLLITGSRPMRSGREITLTLVFARAGRLAISAIVTDPQTGGSSYFLN